MDQRSGDGEINRRSYDVAVNWRNTFSWFRYAWCEDSVYVEKDYLQFQSQKEESHFEEHRAQKHDRILRGRQIAYMIHDHFQATRAFDVVQGISDRMTFKSSIQDGTRFFLATSEIPDENVLEGLNKMKRQGSEKLQTVSALYSQELSRDKVTPKLSKIEDCGEINILIRSRNFRARNERIETGIMVESHRGRKVSVDRNVREMLSVEGNWTVCKRRHLQFQSWGSTWNRRKRGRNARSASPAARAPTQTLR